MQEKLSAAMVLLEMTLVVTSFRLGAWLQNVGSHPAYYAKQPYYCFLFLLKTENGRMCPQQGYLTLPKT